MMTWPAVNPHPSTISTLQQRLLKMEIEEEAQASRAIGYLLMIWDPHHEKQTPATPGIYLGAVRDLSLEAVKMACKAFHDGTAPDFNPNYGAPTAPKLAQVARLFQDTRIPSPAAEQLIAYRIGEEPPEGYHPAGLVEVDFGHRRIDMRGMDAAQQERIMASKGTDIPTKPEHIAPSLQSLLQHRKAKHG